MSKNDITGDNIQTKVASDAYRNNFDAIFRKLIEPIIEENNEEIIPLGSSQDRQ